MGYRQWGLRYGFGIPSGKPVPPPHTNNKINWHMLESTIRRYKIIRKEVYKRLGKMPTMMAYAEVAQEMGLTEETVRKIIRKINKWDMIPTKK